MAIRLWPEIRVQGLGFRVQGLGFRVLGFRVQGYRASNKIVCPITLATP